ncbi:asparagine synthetase B family protein [Streptomonospora nanhaiensis]|uniref:asparagine synthetase B family protein n=1 Tax=Streptomonospora nanhaiensis TaxID=1323731 RepID=UPI001C99A051|nr:asparagine synthetase B [Streptomonospora nanhaiensis]MBX9389806.1 asparagine synthetase B [Streptomonospora nanhaiensis]
MCGIAGLAGPDAHLSADAVAAMGAAQHHRGPDGTDQITAADGRAVLSMNILKIVNPRAVSGPYTDPDTGVALALNGEIYNYTELARRWRIPLAADETDAHLLLRAWIRFGPRVLGEVDGMFAVAVYDPRAARLVLARDRLGEKPVYWRLDGGLLVFASEVTSLTGYGEAPPVLRPEMVALETPTGIDTPHQGIQVLAPGSWLEFDAATGSLRQRRWWDLCAIPPVETTYRDSVRLVADTLASRIPQRAPRGDFALLLSGGLDSSLLAYLLRPPVCVTVRYPGQDRLDESAVAARVAADIGAELVTVEPTIDDFQTHLPRIVQALDYPVGNASTFSEYMAYRAVAQLGVRVAVGGLGPDEFLMGYVRHALALFGAEAVLTAGLDAYRPLAAKLTTAADSPLSPAEAVTRLVTRGPDPQHRVRALVERCLMAAGGSTERALTLVELETAWRPLVATSDKLASAFAVERRSPYLARELVETFFQLPGSHKIAHPARGKRVLRDAARQFGVPERVWASTDKVGFASPVPAWLAGPLAGWARESITRAAATAPAALRPLLHAGLKPSGPFDRTRMQALVAAHWITPSHAAPAAA